MKAVGMFAALMVALAVTGVGFATQWSKSIYIQGTVNTGKLSWKFFTCCGSNCPPGAYCLDNDRPYSDHRDWHCGEDFANPTQGSADVGYTKVWIMNENTAKVEMHNVYPCYFTKVWVKVQNNGTIPLKIEKAIISSSWDSSELTSSSDIGKLDLNGDVGKDIEIKVADGIGATLNPNGTKWMEFWIHVLDNAPQNTTLSFNIEIVAVQHTL